MSRGFSFDLPLDDPLSPVAGDLLVSARTVYEMTEARPIDSRVWGNRWKLTVRRIADRTSLGHVIGSRTAASTDTGRSSYVLSDGTRVWFTTAYRRGETPSQAFGVAWPPPLPPPSSAK